MREDAEQHSLRICVVNITILVLISPLSARAIALSDSAGLYTPGPPRCKGRPLSVVIIFHNNFAIIHPYYVHVYRISTHAMSTQETRCLDPNANNVTLTKCGGGASMGEYPHITPAFFPRGGSWLMRL